MKVLVISFLVMLAMMVAGTPTAGVSDTSDESPAVTQPSLHEVQAMFTEGAKLQDDVAPVTPADPQFAAMGPKDNYIVDCGGSYIKSYMCWYYNNTRCFSGHLTSNETKCLENCQCTKWTESYWGPPSNRELSNDTPADSESSHTAERGMDHRVTPSNNDDKEKRTVEEDPGVYDLSCHSEDQISSCHGVGIDCDQNGQITGPQVASCSPPICVCLQRPGKILN
ncbi:hypothetical protein PG994_006432 [Apiospora phragmitis]|uniref:Uncharacterized protein n=1 Tax=Apiospora phragmitis TaxID=2905665 RepID=A0ABR1VHN9_9PEZI